MSFEDGTIIGEKYRIDRAIGAGGMGKVYEATQIAINRKVAIKQLHHECLDDDQTVMRFHQEAKLAGAIGHDNICEVTDFGTAEDGSLYLVMPLLVGVSLEELIKNQTEITLARVVDIICQVLSALQAAHNARVIHRDLKPSNILITSVGDRKDFVKLLDFGISKVIDTDIVCGLTTTGVVLGTPHYMAPEQARGSKDIDHRVDIYSVGVILYEALVGRRPFYGESYNEVMFKIVTDPFRLPTKINPSIPKSIEAVILKAMARDLDERYSRADDMREDLEIAMAQEGEDAGTSFVKRRRPGEDENTPLSAVQTEQLESVEISKKPKLLKSALILAAVIAIGAIAAVGIGLMRGSPESQVVPKPAPPALAVPVEPVEKTAFEPELKPLVEEAAPAEEERKAEEIKENKVAKNHKKKKKAPKSKEVVEKKKEDDKEVIEGRKGTKIVSEF